MQHKDIYEQLEDDFLRLEISENIANSDRLCTIGEQILQKLPQILVSYDITDIFIEGDTATAFYSAVVAFQMGKRILYIEAGLRTYDLEKPFPEEAYRQMISRIATVLFTPHIDSQNLLQAESVQGTIYNVGNTILDLIASYGLICTETDTVIITFHRRENWNKVDELLAGLKSLIEKTPHIKYIWYLHPNPSLQQKVRAAVQSIPNIRLAESCNHADFTQQIAACNFLITDSGGIQEEASFMGKHCVVLRESTERSHIPAEYITILKDYSKLGDIYENIPQVCKPPCTVYGEGNSTRQIFDILNI